MGNSQSAEAPRKPPNKLSKPKTNKSASTLFSSSAASSSRLTLYTELSTAILSSFAPPSESGEEPAMFSEPSLPEKRQKRLSFFRSKTFPSQPLPDLIESMAPVHDLEAESIPDPLARYSRYGNTSNNHLQPSYLDTHPVARLQRSSTQFQLHSQQQRLSSVSERSSPSLLRAELSKQHGHIIENGGHNNRYSAQSSIHSTEYTNSEVATTYPLRRRSLLMPGVATRGSSVSDTPPSSRISQHEVDISRGNSLHYTPRKDEFHKPVRASTMPAESEMFQIWEPPNQISDHLEEFAPPRWPARFSENERTSTPGDLDYGHLGSKLGLLRITNGAVSPGPSLPDKNTADTTSARTADQENGFMAASEERQNDAEALVQRRHSVNMPAVVETKKSRLSLLYRKEKAPKDAGPERERESKVAPKAKFHIGTECKLKEAKADGLVRDPRSGTEVAELYGDEPAKVHENQIEMPPFSLGQFDFEKSFVLPLNVNELSPPPPPANTKPQSPTTPIEEARAYRQEITSSPFSYDVSSPTSPQFEATSKPSAFQDHLFDDEPDSTVSLTNSFSSGIDSHLSLKSADEKVERVISNKVDNGIRQAPHKPLAKADSGYSSAGSLLSEISRKSLPVVRRVTEPLPVVRRVTEPLPPPVPEKNGPPTPPKEFMTSWSVNDRRQELPSQRRQSNQNHPYSLQRPPVSKGSQSNGQLLSGSSKLLPIVPLQLASTVSSGADAGPPPVPQKSTEQSLAAAKMRSLLVTDAAVGRRQSLPHPQKSNPTRHRASKSDTSVISVNLDAQHELSDLPIVQSSYEIPAASVPPVPRHVSVALAERVKKYPDLTYDRKIKRAVSKETLATIFSVGSAEQSDDTAFFSRLDAPASEGPLSDDIFKALVSGKTVHVPKDGPQTPRKSLDDPVPRRTLSKKKSPTKQEFEHHITSFGTVSESLGASPYDVALSAMDTSPKRFSLCQNLTAAHDVGDRSIARSSILGMDSSTAPQFAVNRSSTWGNEYQGAINGTDEQLGLTKRVLTAPSMFDEAPSVPAVPVKEQVSVVRSPSKKAKSPPPVTMATQRKGYFVAMVSPSVPAPLTPKEPANPMPLATSSLDPAAVASSKDFEPQPQPPHQDIWTRQRELWRTRKVSAESLFAKPSKEVLRSDAASGSPPQEDIPTQSQQGIERVSSLGPLNQNLIVRGPSPAPTNTGQVRNQEVPSQHPRQQRQFHLVQRPAMHGSTQVQPQSVNSSTAKSNVGPRRPPLQSRLGSAPANSHSVNVRLPSLDSSIRRPQIDHRQPEAHSKPKLIQSRSFSNMQSIMQSYSDPKQPLIIDRYSGGLEFGPEFGEITFQNESFAARRSASWALGPRTVV